MPLTRTPDIKPPPIPALPGPVEPGDVTPAEWHQVRDALSPDLRAFLDSLSGEH